MAATALGEIETMLLAALDLVDRLGAVLRNCNHCAPERTRSSDVMAANRVLLGISL